MKVKTSIKAGKKGGNKGKESKVAMAKCGQEASRGQCVACCMDKFGQGAGNLCQAGCGRFYIADEA